ncbi:MAG: glycosyltransferase [Dysgonamonadaceae bacterium]|jgi:glycosyltransferase involved in cell wall biosynthesis|nr:glycosyltransferase [Dysgonamonadaceae bacterium]
MKLSIITINLNNAGGLRKTIESVVNQSFADYEYIVIDGGSSDESVEVIRQYAGKIKYWVSEPDTGIYAAMNKGIRAAKGEYCQFLNSGDTLYSSTVLEEVFCKNPATAILSGNMIRIENGCECCDRGIAFVRAQKQETVSLFDLLVGTINHPSAFICKDLFDRFGLYNEHYRIASDWIFFLQTVGLNGVPVEYIDVTVARFDSNGISNRQINLQQDERAAAIRKFVPDSILVDYKQYQKMIQELKVVRPVYRHRFSRYLCKSLNRLVLLYENLTKK